MISIQARRVLLLGFGLLFNVSDATWYFNLKGYYEFDAKNRPEGWNAWLTLSLPLTPARS